MIYSYDMYNERTEFFGAVEAGAGIRIWIGGLRNKNLYYAFRNIWFSLNVFVV